MLTLAKRPNPQLGSSPSRGITLSEQDYADAMRRLACREGHRPALPEDTTNEAKNTHSIVIEAIIAGRKTVVEIAEYVGVSNDTVRRRLQRMRDNKTVTSAGTRKQIEWSLA